MGVRVYIPALGRFLSVDPVQGGTPNNYVYATDAVNEFDLDGRAIPLLAIGLLALYAGGILWSAYDMWKNPTPANLAWLSVSAIPGVTYAARVSKVTKVVDRLFVLSKGSKGGAGAGQAFTRAQVKNAQKLNSNCAYCGAQPKKIDLDHIVPKSTGGNKLPRNAQPTCPACNRSKGSNSFPRGYSTKQKFKWLLR